MIINNTNNHIKFVSYTGKYPNLCNGVLTLIIDGHEVKFGHDYSKYKSWKTDGNYNSFWKSGGSCVFTDNYQDCHIVGSEWIINVEELPDEYKQYATEFDEVFNDNVPYGCCGGCL